MRSFSQKKRNRNSKTTVPLSSDLNSMSLVDHHDGSSPGGRPDGDLPAFPYQYPIPHPYSSSHPLQRLPVYGGGSQHSEGNVSVSCSLFTVLCGVIDHVIDHTGSHSSRSNCSDHQKERGGGRVEGPEPTKQEVDSQSDGSAQQPPTSSSGLHGDEVPPSGGHNGDFSPIQPEISRQSFRLAMGNPGDLFVDVM